MQAAFYQYHLPQLKVHLLQAKKDLVFLQRPVEVGELFGFEARDVHMAKKSCWTASTQTRLASRSLCTFPGERSEAIDPSSHAVMAPSLLSSSLS
jgi:hypothetical protein